MSKLLAWSKKILCVSFATLCCLTAQAATKNGSQTKSKATKAIIASKLDLVEISKNKRATQIIFGFTGPIRFNRTIIPETHQLLLTFDGMSLKNFDAGYATTQLNQLKAQGLIQNIIISEKTQPSQQVVVILEFANTNESNNELLVQWSTLANSHRLVLNIFLKEDLDRLIQKDSVLYYASNDTQQYDIPLQSAKKKSQPLCVMLDPGHGGDNLGARSHENVWEKDVTLEITKHVHALLKKHGYRSLLTRTHDKDVPLVKRSQLAQELGADLFVSIHANSSGVAKSNAHGIETFYMDSKDLLSTNGQTGFLFVNCEKNASVIKHLDNHVQQQAAESKTLASHIQKGVLDALEKNDHAANNRGVKRGEYRVFLQSGMPTALVEVGFLTNKEEARKLGKSSYRKLLAQGIFDGIVAYLEANGK